MLTQTDLASAILHFDSHMRRAIDGARAVQLPVPQTLPFSTRQLSASRIDALAEQVVTGKRNEERDASFLYLFRLAPDNTVPHDVMLSSFLAARARQEQDGYRGKKNLCRANAPGGSGNVVYIGRSGAPRERLKQHLRASGNGTYAIHFAEWAGALDLRLLFQLYRFDGIGDRAMQVIEDGLWDHLQPLLGKRGEQ